MKRPLAVVVVIGVIVVIALTVGRECATIAAVGALVHRWRMARVGTLPTYAPHDRAADDGLQGAAVDAAQAVVDPPRSAARPSP
ncbi:MAG: hypothetical protein R3F65_23770, partial [bacterium]